MCIFKAFFFIIYSFLYNITAFFPSFSFDICNYSQFLFFFLYSCCIVFDYCAFMSAYNTLLYTYSALYYIIIPYYIPYSAFILSFNTLLYALFCIYTRIVLFLWPYSTRNTNIFSFMLSCCSLLWSYFAFIKLYLTYILSFFILFFIPFFTFFIPFYTFFVLFYQYSPPLPLAIPWYILGYKPGYHGIHYPSLLYSYKYNLS